MLAAARAGIPYTPLNYRLAADQIAELVARFDDPIVTVPPYHVMGVAAILNNVYMGRRMVFLPSFSAQAWLELARAERVTSGTLVPTMMARMVRHLDGRPADVPTLKSIVYGGSRTARSVLEQALRAFPGVDFMHGYGLTETRAGITTLTAEDHRAALSSGDPRVAERLGSAGRAVAGVELQIRDDTIIRGGENIAPAEIEDVLDQHPMVDAAAVVGLPDDEWGERVVAAVVARPGVTSAELATSSGLD
jgi:acyl-CoA synthetase (AMP-forming)/AMP-acid ligase II